MSRLSLGLRSVAAAALAILLAVVLVGAGVEVLVSRHLHRTLDGTLRQRAGEVSRLTASAPAVLSAPGTLDAPIGGTQLSIEVADGRGRIVARSIALRGRVLPVRRLLLRAIRTRRAGYGDIESGGDDLRVYAAPLLAAGGVAGNGAVVVAASKADQEKTLNRLHLFVLGTGLVATILAGLAVALLMRQALRPLGRLAEAAAEVERTGDPRRRLPDPQTRDEVGRLATTLNAMLASLEQARERERRFLEDASHELRTPLTALRGNVAYLARHGASPELLADLEDDAERLARLADDLLVLSREESAAASTDDVRLDELVRSAAQENPRVDVTRADPAAVAADRASLERALANLIRNAELYGPAGGRISVGVEQNDGVARLSVADEGGGPPEGDDAFRRFWRGDGEVPGSGLGLAIVRATAERHGGQAYVDGSRFTIELPVRGVSDRAQL